MNGRRVLSLIVMLAMLATLLVVASPTASAATTLKYPVVKDTYVQSGNSAAHGTETTLMVATIDSTVTTGDSKTAPRVNNVTYGNNPDNGGNLGAARAGLVQYTLPADIDVNDILSVKLKMYVDSVNPNVGARWNRLALYPIGTEWDEGILSTNYDAPSVSASDYTMSGVTAWSTQRITCTGTADVVNTGWIDFDITNFAKTKITEYLSGGGTDTTIPVAFRIQTPYGGYNIRTKEHSDAANTASYIEVVYGDLAPIVVKYVDTNGNPVKDALNTSAEVGTTYTAPAVDDVIIANNKIYSYDASASDSTTITVASGTNTINIVYNEVSIAEGGYTANFETTPGCIPALPPKLTVRLTDGKSATLPVTWDTLNPADFNERGAVVSIPGYITGATGSVVYAAVTVAANRYPVTKDTYARPEQEETVKDNPSAGSSMQPYVNAATMKGDMPFMVAAYNSGGGSAWYADAIPGVTVSEGISSSPWGGSRAAFVQYTLPSGIIPASIKSAVLHMVVNEQNNLTSGWMKVGLYEVADTTWDEYTLDGFTYPAKGSLAAYSSQIDGPTYDPVDSNLPITFDITDYLKNALTANPSKTDFAFTVQAPTAGIFIFTKEYKDGIFASYIELETVPVYAIAVNVTGNGTVSPSPIAYAPQDTGNVTFTITPEEGYQIKSVTFNGTDVTNQIIGNTLSLTGITADGTLEVVFEEMDVPYDIDDSATTVINADPVLTAPDESTGEPEKDEKGREMVNQSLTLGKVKRGSSGYTLVEFGIQYSTNAEFTNPVYFKANNKTAGGYYGVRLYGKALGGIVYYTRPYLKYKNNRTGEVKISVGPVQTIDNTAGN